MPWTNSTFVPEGHGGGYIQYVFLYDPLEGLARGALRGPCAGLARLERIPLRGAMRSLARTLFCCVVGLDFCTYFSSFPARHTTKNASRTGLARALRGELCAGLAQALRALRVRIFTGGS